MDKEILEPLEYEKHIVLIMANENLSLSEALHKDFIRNDVNVYDIYSLTDYLENKLQDLTKVSYYMDIYVGNSLDVELKFNPHEDKKVT